MPIFERPPFETLAPAKDRWTPVYLEHGRLEVDDASVKWIGADYTVLRIPVATVSALLLGPGTVVTHAAMKACGECKTPVFWIGADGLRFYAGGVGLNHDNERAILHARLHASRSKKIEIAKRMFRHRFKGADVSGKSINELRGMEGARVRRLYKRFGEHYGVTWKGREYNPSNWHLADGINKAISAANASLYALCTAVICSMGYLPHLGFIHSRGAIPFVYDMADLYKEEITLEAAFSSIAANPSAGTDEVLAELKKKVEATGLMRRLPRDLEEIVK